MTERLFSRRIVFLQKSRAGPDDHPERVPADADLGPASSPGWSVANLVIPTRDAFGVSLKMTPRFVPAQADRPLAASDAIAGMVMRSMMRFVRVDPVDAVCAGGRPDAAGAGGDCERAVRHAARSAKRDRRDHAIRTGIDSTHRCGVAACDPDRAEANGERSDVGADADRLHDFVRLRVDAVDGLLPAVRDPRGS